MQNSEVSVLEKKKSSMQTYLWDQDGTFLWHNCFQTDKIPLSASEVFLAAFLVQPCSF